MVAEGTSNIHQKDLVTCHKLALHPLHGNHWYLGGAGHAEWRRLSSRRSHPRMRWRLNWILRAVIGAPRLSQGRIPLSSGAKVTSANLCTSH